MYSLVHFWTKSIQYECKVNDKTTFFFIIEIFDSYLKPPPQLLPFGNTVRGLARLLPLPLFNRARTTKITLQSCPWIGFKRLKKQKHSITIKAVHQFECKIRSSNHKRTLLIDHSNVCRRQALSKNSTIYNILRWFARSLGQMTHRPSVWCSEYYYYFFIISCKILWKNCFNLFLYFL